MHPRRARLLKGEREGDENGHDSVSTSQAIFLCNSESYLLHMNIEDFGANVLSGFEAQHLKCKPFPPSSYGTHPLQN